MKSVIRITIWTKVIELNEAYFGDQSLNAWSNLSLILDLFNENNTDIIQFWGPK